MRLRSTIVEVGQLASPDRDAMFRLMDRTYVKMRRERFEDDLNAKHWAIIVRSPTSGDIVGFSTQVVLAVPIDGEIVDALYSGDTVVDREHWGDPALASAWGNFALQLVDRHPMRRMVWFLTSKGFRTYRYLPLFFRTYFPHPARAIPARERKIIEHLGRLLGGDSFDASSQIIRASLDKDFLRPEVAAPGLRTNTDRHVKFFIERNPGFMRGDELCCVSPLTRENFTRAAHRVIRAQQVALNEA
jgi:hypothetical protein